MRVKTAAFTLATVLAILSHSAVVAANAEPTEPRPTGPNKPPGAKDNFGPVYNVCRGTDPRCYRAWASDRKNKVLLYTRTAAPRHANIQPALGPGLDPPLSTSQNIAQRAIKAWLEAKGVEVHWTEDVNTLAGELGPSSNYKAVIFLSTSRRKDRAAAVRARRRRLRRNPQCVRHRVQLALVRRPARQRQLLRPWRIPGRHGQDRRRGFVHVGDWQLRL